MTRKYIVTSLSWVLRCDFNYKTGGYLHGKHKVSLQFEVIGTGVAWTDVACILPTSALNGRQFVAFSGTCYKLKTTCRRYSTR